MRKIILTALLTQTAMSFAPAAFAQGSGEEAKADEIIVTARRREENLSKVPAAITALSDKALAERGVKSDSDLQLVAPGLTIRQTQGNNSLSYSIRGQTADTFSGSPSAVIAYLNEVPLTVGTASSFYDLANVQVLKGPQGTLFGRNATGGAVLFNSAKPTNDLGGRLTGRIGNLGAYEADGMINIPVVSDKVLLRGAFNITRRDGYILNLFNNEMLGKINRNSYRGSLTLKPVEGFANTTMFQYNDVDGSNTGASYVWSIYNTNCAPAGTLNCASSFLNPYVAAQRVNGPYKTNHPGGARHHGFDWLLSNTTTIDLGDVKLKNIFGAAESRYNSVQPQLGAPYVTIATYNQQTGLVGNQLNINSYSDELQLQGDAMDGKLEYIAGAYFQWQKVDTIWPQTYFLAPPYPPTFGTCTAGGGCLTNAFRLKDNTSAFYGQVNYEVSDGLKLTAGFRYTWDRLTFSQIILPTNFNNGLPDERHTYSDPSWEVGLTYQASPELMVYAKTRGSFRAGGFNGARIPATAPGNEFKSEHTQDVEAGLKYNGDLGGRPVTFNFDVFNQWVQDVQRVEFPAGGAATANVPSEIVQGIEGDFNYKASDWFEFGAQAAYVNARYPNGNVVLFGVPYKYGPVADTPKFTGSFYAQAKLPVPATLGELSLRGEVYGQSSQWFSNEGDTLIPDTKLPGYALLSARLTWSEIMGSPITASIYGKNLGNKAYFVGGMPLGGVLGHNSAAVGEPRTYGMELSVKF